MFTLNEYYRLTRYQMWLFFRKQYDRGRIIEKKDKQSLMGKNGEAQKYTK